MLVIVFMLVVVVVIVAFVAVGFLGCSRRFVSFESVSGAQLVLPSGRDRRQMYCLAGCRQWETASCGGEYISTNGKRVWGRGQTAQIGELGPLHRVCHVTAHSRSDLHTQGENASVMQRTRNNANRIQQGSNLSSAVFRTSCESPPSCPSSSRPQTGLGASMLELSRAISTAKGICKLAFRCPHLHHWMNRTLQRTG